jgi:hypothetical protein
MTENRCSKNQISSGQNSRFGRNRRNACKKAVEEGGRCPNERQRSILSKDTARLKRKQSNKWEGPVEKKERQRERVKGANWINEGTVDGEGKEEREREEERRRKEGVREGREAARESGKQTPLSEKGKTYERPRPAPNLDFPYFILITYTAHVLRLRETDSCFLHAES